MNKLYCLIIMFVACRVSEGQNLIPNGDFEGYVNCPNSFNQYDNFVSDWIDPTIGSPDYFNSCTSFLQLSVPDNNWGYQPAHSGNAYSGFLFWYGPPFPPDAREYIEVPLTSALMANSCYHFQMYVSLAEASQVTTNNLSVLFSDTAILNQNDLYAFTPQLNLTSSFITDTLTWILISGNYTATGGESFLIIGNFLNNAISATQLTGFGNFDEAYFYVDDVSLSPCTGIEEQKINDILKIYPNPFTDKVNITISDNGLSEFILFDIASKKIFNQSFKNSISINTEQLPKGIYLYEVRNKNEVIEKGKVVKD